MSNNFTFTRVDNRFCLQDNHTKVEFSNPHIQTFNDVVETTNPKSIMYFYYDVKVFCKEYDDEWILYFEKYVYDFPALLLVSEVIDDCLNSQEKFAEFSTKSSFFDDFYELSRMQVGNRDKYKIVIGGAIEGRHNTITKSIALEYLERSEVEEFQKTVNEFVQYALLEYSNIQKARETFERKNKIIKNNKLYVYGVDDQNVEFVERMFVEGDDLNMICVFKPTSDNKSFYEDEISYLEIQELNQATQTILFSNDEEYAVSDLAFICLEEPTSKLQFGINEIVGDFYGILSDEEKEEFRKTPADILLKKYKWAIINRTWMCRDEHAFEEKYPDLLQITDSGRHERVFEVVYRVIDELKKMCG